MAKGSLDHFLSEQDEQIVTRPRKLIKMLKEAYTFGAPIMIVKPITDQIKTEGKHAFYLGTPDPEMRRIASWLLTKSHDFSELRDLISRLWKRHGREDLKLAGLLLANIPGEIWDLWFSCLNSIESIESLLEVLEELQRSGKKLPDNSKLEAWSKKGKVFHQISVLIVHLRGDDIPYDLIKTAPKGGFTFERIRSNLIQR